jgi:hypothetical protein
MLRELLATVPEYLISGDWFHRNLMELVVLISSTVSMPLSIYGMLQ